MTLSFLKSLLRANPGRAFRLILPGGSAVPSCFHVTEVGRVNKTFIDCGGVRRETVACQLQVWIGPDLDHRLEAGKMAAILEKAAAYLPDESVPVEIEYEDAVISRYTIASHATDDSGVLLHLAHKHTECLAPEKCLVPASGFSIKGRVDDKCRGAEGCC